MKIIERNYLKELIDVIETLDNQYEGIQIYDTANWLIKPEGKEGNILDNVKEIENLTFDFASEMQKF